MKKTSLAFNKMRKVDLMIINKLVELINYRADFFINYQ